MYLCNPAMHYFAMQLDSYYVLISLIHKQPRMLEEQGNVLKADMNQCSIDINVCEGGYGVFSNKGHNDKLLL